MLSKVTDETTLKDWVMAGAPLPERDEQREEAIGKKKVERVSSERRRLEDELLKLDEEQEKLMSDPKLEQAVKEAGWQVSNEGEIAVQQSKQRLAMTKTKNPQYGYLEEIEQRRKAEARKEYVESVRREEGEGSQSHSSSLWKNAKGTHSRITPPATETLLDPDEIEELETVLVGHDGTVYTKDKPREPKGIKDEALKKAMYQAQVDEKGNFAPGPRAKFDTGKLAQQAKCKHPFADLKWGANKKAMYATCTKCGAKSVVCWSKISKEPEDLEAESEDKGESDDHPKPAKTVKGIKTHQVYVVGKGAAAADAAESSDDSMPGLASSSSSSDDEPRVN